METLHVHTPPMTAPVIDTVTVICASARVGAWGGREKGIGAIGGRGSPPSLSESDPSLPLDPLSDFHPGNLDDDDDWLCQNVTDMTRSRLVCRVVLIRVAAPEILF